ncbi:hypothetical protein ADL22_03360 [Streptomyces sp. NRRL F-4489]|uniref:C40 family peptidase n=1 Tax=Streptomyces sp. NRRL F-4489 TaxID=1609095 RepID=UPI00074AE20A|nr:C40 family peptidase [Streptomyces sp. NRRL F-4489]KUL54078.1 hypothetical protein ADL22_03360 [Streptomyces sp. NRRL F-4489]
MAPHPTAAERPPLAPQPGPRVAPGPGPLLAADPQRCLDGATVLERAGGHQATAVAGWARRLGSVRRLGGRPAALTAPPPAPPAPPRTAPALTAPALAAPPVAAAPGVRADPADRADQADRAARAVAYARRALGKPYAWGATGPAAYDCSGLTLAAWRAAGIILPRTTYTQIACGTPVSRDHLAPGDLVFFHSGISHVGLCVGGGAMIHAPRPGTPVELARIDTLPFAAATRPAQPPSLHGTAPHTPFPRHCE